MRTKQHIQPMHDTSSRFKTKLEPLIWTLVFIIKAKKAILILVLYKYYYKKVIFASNLLALSLISKVRQFKFRIEAMADESKRTTSFRKWGSLNSGPRPLRTEASVQPLCNHKCKIKKMRFAFCNWEVIFFLCLMMLTLLWVLDSGFYDWYPHVTVWIENYWYWYILNNLLAKRTGKIFYVSL